MDFFLLLTIRIHFAEKIGLLLLDTQLEQTMIKNARERFLSLFEPSKIIEEQVEWLENIISPNSRN